MTASLLNMLLAAVLLGLAGAGVGAFVAALPWPAVFYLRKPGGCWSCLAGWGVIFALSAAAALALPVGSGEGVALCAFATAAFTLLALQEWRGDMGVFVVSTTMGATVIAAIATALVARATWFPELAVGVFFADAGVIFFAAWALAALCLRALLPLPAPVHDFNDDLERLGRSADADAASPAATDRPADAPRS